MAVVSPTVDDVTGNGDVFKFTWDLTTADHTGSPVKWATWADRSIMFTSAAWGASTAAIEGSNDGITYVGLADPQGTAISKTTNAVEAVLELTHYMQPRLTTVGSGAAVRVTLICRRAQLRGM